MIYICYGMTKSASTLLYQLTEEVFRASGRRAPRLGPPFRSRLSVDNYFDRIDGPLVDRIKSSLNHDDIVLKTHGPLADDIADRIASGDILASASLRDPREIALSMIDHGARSRRWGDLEFSECATPQDCLPSIDYQVETLRQWAAIPRVETFSYNRICFDMAGTAQRLCAQFGVDADIERLVAPFRDPGLIGQFSTGTALRYREMPTEDQRLFLDRYADFYQRWPLDTELVDRVAGTGRSGRSRPSGGIAQLLTRVRRMLRH